MFLKGPLLVVIGSVDDGEDGSEPLTEAVLAVGGRRGQVAFLYRAAGDSSNPPQR
jgi:hypothetical protein